MIWRAKSAVVASVVTSWHTSSGARGSPDDLERTVQITLEVDKCIGSGSCEMMAPEVFEVGEDGLAELLDASPGSEMESKCRAAEESCPTQAITVEV